jgi:replicative DNA helicase Mcm
MGDNITLRSKFLGDLIPKFFKKDRFFNAGTYKNRQPFSYYDSMLELNCTYPSSKSFYIKYQHLDDLDRDLGDFARNDPLKFFELMQEGIGNISFPGHDMPDVEVRITDLPDVFQVPINKLRKPHLNKLISIVCVIAKATPVRPARKVAAFQCIRCGQIDMVPQSEESDDLIEPFFCGNSSCGKKGPWKLLDNQCVYVDTQLLKVQEAMDGLGGRQPEFLHVMCLEDIAGTVKPGDKVIITGVLQGRTKIKREGKTKYIDLLLIANSISKSTKDFENIEISPQEVEAILALSKNPDIDNLIYKSIAPSIFGHPLVKQGLALQLFGGLREENDDGTAQRGDIHILLVGDPGVAKSQFLSYISKFAPRAIMVSGQSATGAGLTGAAVHDDFDGRWGIEAGALSIVSGSNDYEGGICCVDEFDKMRDMDRNSIHGALEQQYVDVAKAGAFAHLATQCALLAAANPVDGRFNPWDSISKQFNLNDALISRMDSIFIIKDEVNQIFDEKLAMHVLGAIGETVDIIDPEFLRKYIAYAKIYCKPVMTDEARDIIVKFYVETRSAGGKVKDSIPITARTILAARRFATAHARLRLSQFIEAEDARAACDLIIKNLRSVGIDPDTGQLDSSVLEAGTTGSQRENIHKIKQIIEEISTRNFIGQDAPLEEILKKCDNEGIKGADIILRKLVSRGDLLRPCPDTYKVIK